MRKKIDFSLAPTSEELTAVSNAVPIDVFFSAYDAIRTGRKDLQGKGYDPNNDFSSLCTYVLMSGYIIGVRNERKRRNRKGA